MVVYKDEKGNEVSLQARNVLDCWRQFVENEAVWERMNFDVDVRKVDK